MQKKYIKKNVASLKKSQNLINVSFIKWIISSCATRRGRFDPTNHMIQGNPADIFTIRPKKLLSRYLGVHEFHINVTVFHGNITDSAEIQIVVIFASIIWTRSDIVKIHSVGINDMVVNIWGTPRNTNHHATPFRNKLVMVPGTFDMFRYMVQGLLQSFWQSLSQHRMMLYQRYPGWQI